MDFNKILDREPISINLKKVLSYVRGKRVLITGAGGSIGSEISKQMLFGEAERLYLLGHGENSIYEIDKELRKLREQGYGEKAEIVPIIGEIQDRDYIFYLLKHLQAEIVFHTAAHKHVPMSEENPVETIKNNVFGTKNLVNASKFYGVDNFVFISTDKAVEPISIYGVSKLFAEEIVLEKGFLVVRFGNVIGSKGSVFLLFEQQILNDEPVSITSSSMYRFFMTIEEAVSLVLKVGGIGKGGNVYVLDMGELVNVESVARKIAKYYKKSLQIKYTGIRRGEKLTEKLWAENEKPKKTKYSKILRLEKKKSNGFDIDEVLNSLYPICFYFYEDFTAKSYRKRKDLRIAINKVVDTLPILQDEREY